MTATIEQEATDALKRTRAIELLDAEQPLSTREIARTVGLPESTLRAIKKDHEAAKMAVQVIPIRSIVRDGGTQTRAEMNPSRIEDYAEAYASGKTLPPPVVFRDGDTYHLADGFHRLAALDQIGQQEVGCEVREGDRRDALLYGLKANAFHGLPRTHADKRHSVFIVLNDPVWRSRSNAVIAEMCEVSPPFVGELRVEWESTQNVLGDTTRTDRNGRQIDTANLKGRPKRGGKKEDGEPEPDEATPEREPGSDDDRGEPETVHVQGDPEPDAEQAYLESLPLRETLDARCRVIFDRDALKYRNAMEWIGQGKRMGLSAKRTATEQGAWEYQAAVFLRLAPPNAWLGCAAEGCTAGLTADGGQCQSCYGRGYRLS
jgi:hypothetical protein